MTNVPYKCKLFNNRGTGCELCRTFTTFTFFFCKSKTIVKLQSLFNKRTWGNTVIMKWRRKKYIFRDPSKWEMVKIIYSRFGLKCNIAGLWASSQTSSAVFRVSHLWATLMEKKASNDWFQGSPRDSYLVGLAGAQGQHSASCKQVAQRAWFWSSIESYICILHFQ